MYVSLPLHYDFVFCCWLDVSWKPTSRIIKDYSYGNTCSTVLYNTYAYT